MYENYYQKYESEEQEVLVLIQRCLGAGYYKEGNFWDMTAISLGMVFPDGSCVIREGRVEWPLTEEETKGEYGWGRLARGQICRLKLRRMKPSAVPEHTTPEKFNAWLLVEVLEPAVSCPELEAYWEEYQKPVELNDEVLGKLTLNRELDWLEGEIPWGDGRMSLSLEIDTDDTETWDKARAFARKLATDAAHWDSELRHFAAKELTELANDWQSSDEENENAPELTEEDFMRRIQPESLVLSWDGNLVAYYDDDDLFFGHVIEISGIESEGLKYANIAG